MFCSKCGNEIKEGAFFCQRCGTPCSANAWQTPAQQQVVQQQPTNISGSGKKSKLGFILIPIALLISMGVGFLGGFFLNKGSGQVKTSGQIKDIGHIEGSGFDSPESAITAYAEAMKSGDLNAMRSCFAAETYCVNFSTEKYIERINGITYQNLTTVPVTENGSSLLSELNNSKRSIDINNTIIRHYTVLSLYDTEFVPDLYYTVYSNPDISKVHAFLRAMQDLPESQSITVGDIVSVEQLQLSDVYYSENNQNSLKRRSDSIGADEIRSAAIRLTVDGEDFLLTLDAARYGDKWYLLPGEGDLSILAGINFYYNGLFPVYELDY